MEGEMRKIDINQADVEELAQIPGIAENLARRIIEYRETVHRFEEVIELAAVPGISERMVREFADWVTVDSVQLMERTIGVPAVVVEPQTDPLADAADEEDEADSFEFMTEPADEEPEPAEPEAFVVEEEVTAEVEKVTAVPEPTELEEGPEPADEEDTAELPPLIEPMKVEPEPDPEPEPEPMPRPVPQRAAQPSSGRVLGQILLGSILGAFVGALLTLAILAALNNGTLSFTQADTRLQGEIQNAQQAQTDLSQTVDNLGAEFNTNLGAVATRTGDLFTQQQETDASLQEMTSAMRQTQIDVTALEEVTQALDERLTTVAAAAETFDAFLDGLRDLLVDLDGGPGAAAMDETATPLATAEASPAATDEATESAATAVPSPTSRPTRTPRPTATPVPVPTSTPGQQP